MSALAFFRKTIAPPPVPLAQSPASDFLADQREPTPPETRKRPSPRRYRTLWISDVHLGTKGCKAAYLLDFLRHHDAETWYLVGDIVDGWQIKRSWFWHQLHNDVIQKLLRKVRKGSQVIYVPGNHDEAMRHFTGLHFGGILVASEYAHRTADGKTLLVTHGDQFDSLVRYARWLSWLGDWSYQVMLKLNNLLNRLRRHRGLPYWSLNAFIKGRVKNAMAYIARFEQAVVEDTRRRGFDGVVCGHIHHPAIQDHNGILYCNDGDWVENCTALAEHPDGRLEILHWARERDQSVMPEREAAAVAGSQPTRPRRADRDI